MATRTRSRYTRWKLNQELGKLGLGFFSGYVTEAYTRKLQWPEAYRVYNEMRRRDPTLRSLLNAVRLMANDVEWKVEAWDDTPEARQVAEFVESALWGMETQIDDVLDDALTALAFGWAWFEQVFTRDESGRIVWAKLAFRRQSTWDLWEFDEKGNLLGMWQAPPPHYERILLPAEKSFHFVPERDGGNPEGLSLFESVYEPWYFVRNLQIMMGIGWQRSFVGLPVFEWESPPSDDDMEMADEIGQGLVVNDYQYVSVPAGAGFRLETVTNTNAGALLETIQEYRRLILATVMADFLMLGAGQTGSWALGKDKSTLFLMAVNGWLDRFASQFTNQCIRRLLEANGMDTREMPWLSHSTVMKPDLEALARFVSQVAEYVNWGEEDVLWLRQQAGLPEVSANQAEAAEFVEADLDPGADRLRRELERLIADVASKYLRDLLRRVVETVRTIRTVLPDDFWSRAVEEFRSRLLTVAGRAVQDMIQWAVNDAQANMGIGVDWTLVNAAALEWAREYTIRLSDQIITNTKSATHQAIQNWIESGAALPELTKALEPIYGPKRAELIATTEITRIFAEANRRLWKELGVVREGRWNTAMDERVCPICAPLNGKTVRLEGGQWRVKIRGKWADVKQPPAHPRCRCWLTPVV